MSLTNKILKWKKKLSSWAFFVIKDLLRKKCLFSVYVFNLLENSR